MQPAKDLDLTNWLETTRDALADNGWRVIPWYYNKKLNKNHPMPYGEGQDYNPLISDAWENHPLPDMFSVALDDAILLDIDFNKENCIDATEFKRLFGDLGRPFQWRESDNSTHYLFRLPDGFDTSTLKNSADGQLADGVDIKRGNQLIHIKADKVFPRGIFPNPASLPFAPSIIIDALTRTEETQRRTPLAELTYTDETTPYGRTALAAACEAIVNATERNNTFNIQTMRMFQLVAGGEIAECDAEEALISAAQASGLEDGEIQATYESGRKKGLSEPRKASVASPDEFPLLQPEEILTALSEDPAIDQVTNAFSTRFRLMKNPGGKVEIKANNYCVRDVLPAKGIGLVVGKSSAGKTFCALSLAASIASGRGHWGGRFCAKGSVVYIAGEPGVGLAHRVRALALHWNSGNLFPNLHITEHAIRMSDQLKTADGKINQQSDVYELMRYIKHINDTNPDSPVRLVVIDTVSQTMAGDQNSRQDVSNYLNNYALLANTFGLCVMGLHHVGKDESRGATGSAAWRDNVDFLIQVSRGIGDSVTLHYDKLRDGESEPETFKLKTVRYEEEVIDKSEAAFAIEQEERPNVHLDRYTDSNRMASYSTLVFDDLPVQANEYQDVPIMPAYPDPENATSRESLLGALLVVNGGRATVAEAKAAFDKYVAKLEQAKPTWKFYNALQRMSEAKANSLPKVVVGKVKKTDYIWFPGFENGVNTVQGFADEFEVID